MTETGMLGSRAEAIRTLDAVQRERSRPTPRVVVVEDASLFGANTAMSAMRVLGWDAGRLKTQDHDWDHLAELGWAVQGADGTAVLYEGVDAPIRPLTKDRALELGILATDGTLSEWNQPTIAECRSVSSIGITHYSAECVLDDGRVVDIVGKTATGDLPKTGWFEGRTPDATAEYAVITPSADGPHGP